ncbi:AhpC/TSA antioxidant enzyme-domain-containing protein [Phanerochaete sordida]|uniref:AhpC/TSA antioxidant enzyme-domain-containing protein n=1 Tax=Phanerochaete sordida TaxID=48140 RepID=A0A9P3GJR5_9APHY|nr:AhpC/TSA antioxidant enzyme-domain-containing protein [Phanerochaete sordida]
MSPPTTRIKRKPPPSFPYSPRYPPPDPADPFVPLAVLRSRAHSSSTALDSPELQSTRPSTADSRGSHLLVHDTPDVRASRIDSEPQRPWYGLAKGYLSEAAKPLRPPRSRKRPAGARDVSAYFSDADVVHERRLTLQAQNTPRNAAEPLTTPKTKRASVVRRDSYHYRRRSQSVHALSTGKPGAEPPLPPPRGNASAGAQYAYDVRQSHGYVFGEVDRLEFLEYEDMPQSVREQGGEPTHGRSRSSTGTSSGASRNPTPPMTPDDTISSVSMTSPPAGRDVSWSPPMLLEDLPPQRDSKPLPVPSEDHSTVTVHHSNRNTLVGDTPVNEYSILMPPKQAMREPTTPPSTDEEALGPLASTVSRLPGRSVESDTEVTVVDSLRRRSRTTSLSEMRRRLRRQPVVTTSIRAKGISSPSPISPSDDGLPSQKRMDKTLSAIIDTSSVSTTSTPIELKIVEPPPEPPAMPKPKKSLSHVDLGLKPLPNMSLAPTIAPSANTSIASVTNYGALTLTRPRDDLVRPQSVPVPALPERMPDPRRTQTGMPHLIQQPIMSRRSVVVPSARQEYESDEEDTAVHSMYTDFARAMNPVTPLLPSPLIDPPPRASSPIPIPKPSRPDMHRLDSHHSATLRVSPPQRTESPPPRMAAPVPKTAVRQEVPACYRKPEPLPLSPPPRAKSPIATHFTASPTAIEDERGLDASVPARTRSPVPAQSLSRAKGVQDVRKMEDDERASQRSSQRSRSRSVDDGGYLPVAQLHPTMSRQTTTHSRASTRPGTSRGLSTTSVKTQLGTGARCDDSDSDDAQETVRVPPRGQSLQNGQGVPGALSAVPARIRGPEPARALRGLTKPMKDLDSPLPPPPKEFLVRAAAAERSPTPPPRALTSPEPRSPPAAFKEPARRQRIGSAPAALPDADAFVHGRACSPARSNTSRGLGQGLEGAFAEREGPLPEFDEDRLPSREQLARAAELVVVAQTGVRVPFGGLFAERKTVVVFIRHFWCPLCQDYMYSISRNIDPDALRRANLDLVVIGNGSPAMIRAYKQIFRMPFQLFTDPSHKVYHTLGMTLRTTDPGPEERRGRYVRHGLVGGIAMVVRNALRVGMPVWEKGGDHGQLGGEFVLGPGLTCAYAHRMKNTRSHAPILDVIAAAGVQMYAPRPPRASEDDDNWRGRREPERKSSRKPTRDCDDPEYCGTDEGGYEAKRVDDRRKRSTANSRRHVREVVEELDSTEDEREREHLEARRKAVIARARAKELKKGPRSYRVANPDRPHGAPRGNSTDKYSDAPWRPSAQAPQIGALQHDEEGYMIMHEALSYSFGNTG